MGGLCFPLLANPVICFLDLIGCGAYFAFGPCVCQALLSDFLSVLVLSVIALCSLYY